MLAKVRETCMPKIRCAGPLEAGHRRYVVSPSKAAICRLPCISYCGQLGKAAIAKWTVTLSIANHHPFLRSADRLLHRFGPTFARREKAHVSPRSGSRPSRRLRWEFQFRAALKAGRCSRRVRWIRVTHNASCVQDLTGIGLATSHPSSDRQGTPLRETSEAPRVTSNPALTCPARLRTDLAGAPT